MRLRFWIFIISLLVATGASAAELAGDCNIRFFSSSTLHDFDGRAACEPFSWPVQEDAGSGRVLIRDAVIRIPVAAMETANDKRDEKMFEMFSVETFPLIEGRFGDLDPSRLLTTLRAEDAATARLPFELRIRDLSRPVEASVKDLRETPGRISFVALFPVSLADFQLKPPSVLGLIRVADEVRVEVEVTLQHDNLSAETAGAAN